MGWSLCSRHLRLQTPTPAYLRPRMAITFFLKNKKPILGRCSDDYSTKMRLRYAPFYHAMESQHGTTIQLDGKEMIMLSSNDYLGLSFHPKVIEAGRAALLKWGTSTTGARPSNGSRTYHLELEQKIFLVCVGGWLRRKVA